MSEGESVKSSSYIEVNGTMMWYYYICPREVWLIGHQITPYKEDDNMEMGRYISENSYRREKKEVALGPVKIDVLSARNGRLIVGEVKKSSKYMESAKMQLLLYLEILQKAGIEAEGELRIPLERKREKVVLDEDNRKKLENAKRDILRILYLDKPPEPKKVKWCTKCAYREFCWS
jgi:CRISPR-associated exonuclease Cas4